MSYNKSNLGFLLGTWVLIVYNTKHGAVCKMVWTIQPFSTACFIIRVNTQIKYNKEDRRQDVQVWVRRATIAYRQGQEREGE